MLIFRAISICAFNNAVFGTKHIFFFFFNIWLVNETEWKDSVCGEATDPETSLDDKMVINEPEEGGTSCSVQFVTEEEVRWPLRSRGRNRSGGCVWSTKVAHKKLSQ